MNTLIQQLEYETRGCRCIEHSPEGYEQKIEDLKIAYEALVSALKEKKTEIEKEQGYV